MSTKFTNFIYKLFCWPLMLGIVFALVDVDYPAKADSNAQQTQATMVVPNDDFDNALVITTVPYTHTQDVIDATTAVDDPGFTCYYDSKRFNSVWYRFTPSVSETLIFSTDGSNYFPLLAIWTGVRGSLVSQACSTLSQVELAVNVGTVYYIEIARRPDYIIPPPVSMNLVFSVWSADTPPAPFIKSAPANGATNQSSKPILQWDKSTYAANYEYCYDTSNNDSCDTAWVSTTATSASLSNLSLTTNYYWQVRALNTADVIDANGGAWWSFTTVNPDDLNHWAGTVTDTARPMSFDALNDGTQWLNFSVSVSYNGCSSSGYSTVSVGGPGTITNRSFSYGSTSSTFAFNGTFNSQTTAAGTYNLNNYPICDWITVPGYCCWVFTSGSGTWTASGPPLTTERQLYLPLSLRNNDS